MALIAAAAATVLPAFSAQTRLLVVAPHPDDETIATGLLIQQVRAAGGAVQVLLLTAGDNNPWPQRWLERRLWIGAGERVRWGRRRLQEMQQALLQLGVPTQAMHFLDWPDLGVTGRLLQADRAPLATLHAALARFAPSLIAIPALEDRHPDHAAAHVLVRLALAPADDPPAVLTYLIHGTAPLGDDLDLGGSSAQRTGKLAALAAHRSQLALSGGRMRRMACRPERYRRLTPPASPVATLPWRPPFWLQPWLQLSVISPAGTQTWRWRAAPLRRDDSGRSQLPATAAAAGQPRFVRLALRLPTPWIFDHWGWREL